MFSGSLEVEDSHGEKYLWVYELAEKFTELTIRMKNIK